MMLPCNVCLMVLGLIVLGSPPGLEGYPVDPAGVAIDPAVVSSPPVATVPVEPTATKSEAPSPQQPVQGGEVTEHKNPDGSTITITRYNGPLPANAFQNPFASGPFRSPFFGYGYPFG